MIALLGSINQIIENLPKISASLNTYTQHNCLELTYIHTQYYTISTISLQSVMKSDN